MATKEMKEYVKTLAPVLAGAGITEWEFEETKKHPRIRYNVAGSWFTYPFPKTASDYRSVKNSVSDLRKAIVQAKEMTARRAAAAFIH